MLSALAETDAAAAEFHSVREANYTFVREEGSSEEEETRGGIGKVWSRGLEGFKQNGQEEEKEEKAKTVREAKGKEQIVLKAEEEETKGEEDPNQDQEQRMGKITKVECTICQLEETGIWRRRSDQDRLEADGWSREGMEKIGEKGQGRGKCKCERKCQCVSICVSIV